MTTFELIDKGVTMLPTKHNILIIIGLSSALLIAVGFTYQISRNVVDKTIIRHQEETATEAANTVEIWMAQQKKILKATIASLPIKNIHPTKDTFLPLHMAMAAGHFTDVYIGTEEDGNLIDGAGWEVPPWYDPRWRPWYKHAVEIGKISFTTPYIDLVTHELVIALVEPLFQDNELMGVIGADTILDSLEQNVLKMKNSDRSFTFIVESGGTILVHPNRDYVMRKSIFKIEQDLKNKISQFEGETPQSIRFQSDQEKDLLLSYKRIGNSSWFSCVIAPYEEAKKLARENTTIFTIDLILRALGIMALIVLLSMTGSGAVVLFLGKRYSSTLKKYKNEMTGISKDLKWNIVKRKEVETYYQTLFNVANDAILISKDLKIAECNQKTEEMFAIPTEKLLEKTLLDLSPTYQPDGTTSSQCLQKIIASTQKGEQLVFRWTFSRKNGIEFPASVSIKSFELKDENLLFSSIRDISKRIDAEAQLMQAQKMAAIGEMLGIIAHQWRQPLNTLSTYISSLQAAQYNDMLSKSFVEKLVFGADGQIKFMSKTIDDFRNFFKPSKTKGYLNIFDVIMDAVRLMEAQIKDANIKLIVKNSLGDQNITVYGYKSEFIHVIVNIIANARDALKEEDSRLEETLEKKIEIHASCEEESVIIKIKDNGTGIPEHILPHIFNPYYTTKSSQSGTGIGLYMAKMIVEKEMNGQLTTTSHNSMTCFTIKLQKFKEEATQ
jgi:PAS domain S-box-containing protein